MNLVYQSAFLKALGWSLLDSLWQMGILWLVYICLTANGKKFQAKQRHSLALLSLAGGSLWFLVSLTINFYNAAAPAAVVNDKGAFISSAYLSKASGWIEQTLPFLSVLYLAAACFLFIRFFRQYRHTHRLYKTNLQKVHPEWRVFMQHIAAQMGIKKKISIWFSPLADTPLTLGFWKPVILLPIAAVNNLSIKQAEAIILHELNHIQRNDYLINLLIACTDIILFFNPFARLLSNIIRKERENSCDDLVLQFRYDAPSYAQALLTLEQQRKSVAQSLVLAATGKNQQLLLNRVKRMLQEKPAPAPVKTKFFAYLIAALLFGVIGLYNPGQVIVKTLDKVVVAQNTRNTDKENTPLKLATTDLTEDKTYKEEQVAAPDITVETIKEQEDNSEEYAELVLQHFEELIELATEIKLAAIEEKIKQTPIEVVGYASAPVVEPVTAYTLPESETPLTGITSNVYPYIPSNSYSYQVMEDTSLSKKYILTNSEKYALEAQRQAMQSLRSVDWKAVQQELAAVGKKLDPATLKKEALKALQNVDWENAEESVKATLEEFRVKFDYSFFNKTNSQAKPPADHQEMLKEAQQKVLLQRMQQQQELKKMQEELKKECDCEVKLKKKIVHI